MTQQELTDLASSVRISIPKSEWEKIADKDAEGIKVGERAALTVDKLEGISENSAPFLAEPGLTIQGDTLAIKTVGEFTVVLSTYKEEAIEALGTLKDKSRAFNLNSNDYLQNTVEVLKKIPVRQGTRPESLETMTHEEWAAIADPEVANVDPNVRGLLIAGSLQGMSIESAKYLANIKNSEGPDENVIVSVEDLARYITIRYDADYEAYFEYLATLDPTFDIYTNETLNRVLNSLYFPDVYSLD